MAVLLAMTQLITEQANLQTPTFLLKRIGTSPAPWYAQQKHETGWGYEKPLAGIVKERFDILGKDFLSVAEAAHYCCLGLSQFASKAAPQLTAHDFCGKKVYRVADLRALMEKAPLWQRSLNAVNHTSSTGAKVDGSSVAHLVPYPNKRPRRC